jgi:hypothetical protein
MTPIRWGILSTALIGTQRVVPGMRKSPLQHVAAMASRDLQRARLSVAALTPTISRSSWKETHPRRRSTCSMRWQRAAWGVRRKGMPYLNAQASTRPNARICFRAMASSS